MICAMVLAAGQSRRMGAEKLLLPLAGRPVIARIVDEVLSSPVDRVFVVVGREERPVRKALGKNGRRVHFVAGAPAGKEMLISVRRGLAAMPKECAAVLVALGDQPEITADVIAGLIRVFYEKTAGRGIVVPTFGGRRGHPILFAMQYRDEILDQYENVGLRGLLQAHPEDVCELEVAGPAVLEDMDTPEDYSRAVARFSNRRSL